ncbi:GroES-like protein [Infundibulicybe gibba]|nr:GroES-like protein [Infundibulicybe gibba]
MSSSNPEQKHKALILPSKCSNFHLGLVDTPISPGPGELLVKIEAVGLNPADGKIQKDGIFLEDSNYPAILGLDVAGTVLAVGDAVVGFAQGDRVVYEGQWGHRKRGGFQCYGLADASITAKIPQRISFAEGASIPVGLTTALIGLYNSKPHGAGLPLPYSAVGRNTGEYGKTVIVLGGSSSVGQYATQLARLSGFANIIVTASLKHEQYLRSLGATHVVDRYTPASSFLDEVRKITADPVSLIYNANSTVEIQKAAYSLLPNGGKLITIIPTGVQPEEGKDIILIFGIWTLPHTRPLGIEAFGSSSPLESLLEECLIKPNRVEVLPGGLGAVVGGLEKLGAGQVSGVKLIVKPWDTPDP